MSSTANRATQASAGDHEHSPIQSLAPVPRSSSPLSATLVHSATIVHERPSVKLKIIGGKSNIVNSVVLNAAGQSLYSISSDSKRTTIVAFKDSADVATVEWNRSSPRMVFRGKKVKCKEWLPLAGPETESRILTHGDSQFSWMNKSSKSGYLVPANRPGLSVARWRTRSHTDDLDLKILREVLVESSLLEAIVVSVVLLRSGRSLGDTTNMTSSPRYYGFYRYW